EIKPFSGETAVDNVRATGPFGVTVSCAGTTTRCMQEAINTALKPCVANCGSALNTTPIDGVDLDWRGGNFQTGGAFATNLSGNGTTIYFPSNEGKKIRIGAFTTPVQKWDSLLMTDIEQAGNQPAAFWFRPATKHPLEPGIGIGDSYFRATTTAGAVSDGTNNAGVFFDWSGTGTVAMAGTKIEINEVNLKPYGQ